MGRMFQIIELEPRLKSFDYEAVLQNELDHIVDIVSDRRGNGIKFYMGIELEMEKTEFDNSSDDDDNNTEIKTFQTSASLMLPNTDIEEEIEKHISEIVNEVDEYQENGSGWVALNVESITLMITKYSPFPTNDLF